VTDVARTRRPVVVTIAVVLVYIAAIADVALGIFVLLSRYQVTGADVLFVSLLGAGIILFGLLLIAIASGLARGSRLSRVLATGFLAILMVLRVATILSTDTWDVSAIAQTVLAAFALVVLWTPPGARHFARVTP
jgi:CDP-diglyceride synthetase